MEPAPPVEAAKPDEDSRSQPATTLQTTPSEREALVEKGMITAVGTHHDLLQANPVYRALLSQEAEERAS